MLDIIRKKIVLCLEDESCGKMLVDNKHWQETWWMDTSSWMFTQGMNVYTRTNIYKSFWENRILYIDERSPSLNTSILGGINIDIVFLHAILLVFAKVTDGFNFLEIHLHIWWNTDVKNTINGSLYKTFVSQRSTINRLLRGAQKTFLIMQPVQKLTFAWP